MSVRMSSVGANLAVVETKPIDPDSLPTPAFTDVPSSCSAFDSASPSRVVVPSLSIEAAMLAMPRRFAVSNWSAPPCTSRAKNTSGKSCFSETMSTAPLLNVALRPRGHAQFGRLRGRRDLRPVEDLLAGDGDRAHGHRRGNHEQASNERVHRFTSGRGVSSAPVTFWLSPAFDACSGFPFGTTLSTIRPFVRYWLATRFTSAAVTDVAFWNAVL